MKMNPITFKGIPMIKMVTEILIVLVVVTVGIYTYPFAYKFVSQYTSQPFPLFGWSCIISILSGTAILGACLPLPDFVESFFLKRMVKN